MALNQILYHSISYVLLYPHILIQIMINLILDNNTQQIGKLIIHYYEKKRKTKLPLF